MTLFTVSVTALTLALFGLYVRRKTLNPPWHTQPRDPPSRRTEVLWLGCMAAPLLAIAFPTSPIFGGTKHWITAYPFIALFAGWGFVGALYQAAIGARKRLVSFALGALFLLPGLMQTAHSHPFGLSHYGPIAGGVPGAADLGMNRQFWGFTTGSLAGWIAERLPNGGSVWPCDTTRGAWAMMQRDGVMPSNIRPAASMGEADLVLVHHEAHFREVDYQAWVSVGTVQPVYVLQSDGVPIISVYARD